MRIEVKNLYFHYNKKMPILKNINLILDSMDSVAIIGENGAGKTTLMKHLNGLLRSEKGDIIIDGENIKEKTTAELSKVIVYSFQNPDDQLFLDSVEKELKFGPTQIGMDPQEINMNLKKISYQLNLQNKLHVHPFDLSTTDKKFCTIASILMMNPRIVLFDEPTCGQDYNGISILEQLIKELTERGVLCIAISHDMKFVANNFKRVIAMKEGEIVLDGNPEEVFSQVEILEDCFVERPEITNISKEIGINHLIFNVNDLIKELNK